MKTQRKITCTENYSARENTVLLGKTRNTYSVHWDDQTTCLFTTFTHKEPKAVTLSLLCGISLATWVFLSNDPYFSSYFSVTFKPNSTPTNFRLYPKNILFSTYRCMIKRLLLTETNASVTLVRTEGRNEWMRILCSVTANTSRVTAFSGPKFWSSVENLPPLLQNTNTLVSYKVP